MTIHSWGRYYIRDDRDKRFPLKVKRAPKRLKSKNWTDSGWHGDQGPTPYCVGFAWAHWLHASPIRQYVDPSGIYEFAQHVDEWEGNDYEGTSVRAGAKVLTSLGAIAEYRWTVDADSIASRVLTQGPVVIGVDMFEGMMQPNRAGIMSLDGRVLGGHAMCVIGYNVRNELFRLKNSYGTSWGKNGYGYLSITDMQVLMDRQGECCVGVERELQP